MSHLFHIADLVGQPWNIVAALAIAAVGLLIAMLNYRRKAGVQIRGTFSITSTVACHDNYVSSVTLENLKDRAVTVFAIYLRIGYNFYIEIEDFAEKPLLLKGFEHYHAEYGPIEGYTFNGRCFDMNSILHPLSKCGRLVLSTSDGKYVVPRVWRRWDPVYDHFKNNMTAILGITRRTFKGKPVGGNVKYIVEFIDVNGKEEVCFVFPNDHDHKNFKNFKLTPDSLANKDALVKFLNDRQKSGAILCETIRVHDVDEWRKKDAPFAPKVLIKATLSSFLRYFIWGRWWTWQRSRRMHQANMVQRRHREEQERNAAGFGD